MSRTVSRASYSRAGTDDLSNDEESASSDLEGDPKFAKREDFSDVQWLEFMCVSRWSEELRRQAREEVQKLKGQKDGAKEYFLEQRNHSGEHCGQGYGKNTGPPTSEWINQLNDLDAVTCIQYIELLHGGNRQRSLRNFLESLCMEVEWADVKRSLMRCDHLKRRLDESGEQLTPFQSMADERQPATIAGHVSDSGEVSDVEDFIKHVSTYKWRDRMKGPGAVGHLCSHIFTGTNRLTAEVSFACVPAVQLLRQDTRNLAMLLKSLIDAGLDSRCFNSPFAVTVLSEACERTTFQVWLESLVDVAFILLLGYLSYTVRHFYNPNFECAVSLAFVALFTAIFNLTAALGGFFFYANSLEGSIAATAKWLTLWNTVLVLSDIYSVMIIAKFLLHFVHHLQLKVSAFNADCHARDGHYPKECYVFHHPNYFSILVLIRWTHLGLSVLQHRRIGAHIVPVVHAVTKPASRYFMFFLCLVVLGSFHAYFVFPIGQNVDSFDYLMDTFMKLFRLEVLGDFDLNELEGLDTRINATLVPFLTDQHHPGRISGTIEDGEHSRYYHHGVRGEFVILSIVVTVVAMNVYIGLLSELYAEAKNRHNQVYHHYLAEVRYRHLCRVYVIERCCWRRPRKPNKPNKRKGLYWVYFRRDELEDKIEDDEQETEDVERPGGALHGA